MVNFLNRGVLISEDLTSPKSLENKDLGTITGNFIKPFPIGSKVKLLIQPEDLHHDDTSNLKFEVVDKWFNNKNVDKNNINHLSLINDQILHCMIKFSTK